MSIRQGKNSIAGAPKDAIWGSIEGTITDQVDLNNLLATKMDSKSAALTGTPTAPTPTKGVSNSQIATTEFVQTALEDIDALQNTATGSSSLSISGVATTASYATNIGISSQAKDSFSVAVGTSAVANANGIAIGYSATTGSQGISIGGSSNASNLRSIAVGVSAKATANYAIQIGVGTNSTANTLSIGLSDTTNYTLLNSDGTIPYERLTNALTSSSSGENVSVYKVETHGLPTTYQEIEYIETNTSCYINTGFTANQDTRFILDFTFLTKNFIYGADNTSSGNSKAFGLNVSDTSSTSTFRWHYDDQAYVDVGSAIYGQRYTVDQNKNKVYLDGSNIVTFTYSSFTCPNPIILGAIYRAGSIQSGSRIRIHSCQIYDNGTLVRNMYPCYRVSDNVLGMYDLVNSVFYTNAGSSSFVAGDSVTTSITKINALTGLSATTNELNYVSGVTSSIQTQLNNKQASGSYLTTNTAQNITAIKTSTITNGLEFKSSSAQSKSTPITGTIQELNAKDANDSIISTLGTQITTTGSYTYLTTKAYDDSKAVTKEGTISITASSAGVVTSAPAPTDDTLDSTQIDTVGARNTKLSGYVDKTSAQDISGTKNFNGGLRFRNDLEPSTTSTKSAVIENVLVQTTLNTNGLVDGASIIRYQYTNGNRAVHYRAGFRNSAGTGNLWPSVVVGITPEDKRFCTLSAEIAYAPTPTEDTTTSTQIDTVGARNTKLGSYVLKNDAITASTTAKLVTYDTKGLVTGSKTISESLGYTPANDSNVVHLAGSETITGSKTFTANPVIKGIIITSGTESVKDLEFRDTDGKRVGIVRGQHTNSDGRQVSLMVCSTTDSNKGGINVRLNPDDTTVEAYAPTPTEDTTTSTQIDTVGARNTKLNNKIQLVTELPSSPVEGVLYLIAE